MDAEEELRSPAVCSSIASARILSLPYSLLGKVLVMHARIREAGVVMNRRILLDLPWDPRAIPCVRVHEHEEARGMGSRGHAMPQL